jgi:hypothetical protein
MAPGIAESGCATIAEMPAGHFWVKAGSLPNAESAEDETLIRNVAYQMLCECDVPGANWWQTWRRTVC